MLQRDFATPSNAHRRRLTLLLWNLRDRSLRLVADHLETAEDFQVAGHIVDPIELLVKVRETGADVVVLESERGERHGISSQLLDEYPHITILGIFCDADGAFIEQLCPRQRTIGHLGPTKLAEAIRQAVAWPCDEAVAEGERAGTLQLVKAPTPTGPNDKTAGSKTRAWLRGKLLSARVEEVSFARRGFEDGPYREHLESIGYTFMEGFNHGIETDQPAALSSRLEAVPPVLLGFAYEGAAMALALRDLLSPTLGDRLMGFLEGPACDHVYTCHVGAGWAIARVPFRRSRLLARLDPLYRWLAGDGYGFHEGFFHWHRWAASTKRPRWLKQYWGRTFDQGLGRSLWFVFGGRLEPIAQAIGAFDPDRRADMWAGVGLGSSYAGPFEETTATSLRNLSRPYLSHVTQGVTFAAKAREVAKNASPHTERACRLLIGLSAHGAASITDEALEDVRASASTDSSYDLWRARIRAHLEALGVDS